MGSTVESSERIPWVPIALLTAIATVLGAALYFLLTPSGTVMQCSYNWGVGIGT